MNKFDQKASQKLVSFVFIALMLCSIFAGAVSAENISENPSDNTILNETELYDDFNTLNSSDNHSLSSEIDTLLNTKPIFLFFYADWCHFCQQQKPIIDELEQEYADKIAFIRVNAEENAQATNEFGVTGFPAMFLIVDKEVGYVYQEFGGFTEKEVLKDGLEYVLKTGNLFDGFDSSSLRFNQIEIGNISTFNEGNSSVDCHCKFLWWWCQKCFPTKEEAIEYIQSLPYCVEPKNCFVWKDGPEGHPWRKIPGYGCAHFVAHQLGIKKGGPKETCFEGYSIKIKDKKTGKHILISGRTEVPLKCCKKGDVWTTEGEGHSGVVVEDFKDGEVKVNQCGVSVNYPRALYFSKGKCWTNRKLCEDKSTRTICRDDTVVTQEYDGCKWVDKSKKKCSDGYKCVEKKIDECKSTAQCKKTDDPDVPPGNDKPDDNYDVSTSKITSNSIFNPETPEVAALFKGFPLDTQKLLTTFTEPVTFVDVSFSPDLVNDYLILIIPTGGLYGLDSLISFKSNLEQYVNKGGTLIVFSQQHGYEYSVLPGGNLSGFGWLEDQSCHYGSVYIDTYHPILSGQDSVTSDVNVDGYFTKYPENATILLSRTKNGMPAMLMYEYGKGTVIASTIYTDWASTHYQATQDGKNLVRDIITWAKDRTEIPEYGTSDIINISVNVTNIYLPVSSVEQYEPGDTVVIPINVTNYANITLDKVSFSVLDPGYEIDYVNVSVSIPPNESRIVNFTYLTTNGSKIGTYFFFYSLYAGETVIVEGEELEEFKGAFALVINTTNLSTYQVNFTLTDPDKKIVKQENISVYVPPGDIKTVNFTYANPSKLGIWNLEYKVLDYNNTLIDSGTEKFAVSKYAENPDGFVYHGKDITFTVSSPEEQYAYGSDVPFTIHIYNHRDVDRNISFSTYYKDWSLRTRLPEQNVEGCLEVPAGGDASFTHILHVGDTYLSHNQLIIYASFSEDGSSLGRTEKVVWMFHPSVNVQVETDQKEYAKGEDVSVLLNLTNKQSAACNATVTVRTLDPDNNKVFEDTFNANLSAYESLAKTLSFTLPTTSEHGIYLVAVEAYSDGRKIGSGSAYFEVMKGYMVKINFDKPDKAYKIRENMNIELEITNIGSALWSSAINISIPILAFEDSKYVSLNPNETKKFSYNLNIPETTLSGKHDVIVTISFDNAVKRYYFVIPDSKLILSSEKTSYNAGGYLGINLTNVGGVDTTYNCSIKFSDSKRFVIYENSTQGDILAGENKIVGFEIPDHAVDGEYYLMAECKDLNTNKITKLSKSYSISGLKAALTSITDKKVYFSDENVSILTNITNLDGAIVNGTLNLKIYSKNTSRKMRASATSTTSSDLATAEHKITELNVSTVEESMIAGTGTNDSQFIQPTRDKISTETTVNPDSIKPQISERRLLSHALSLRSPSLRVLMIMGGHTNDLAATKSDFESHMEEISFDTYWANTQTPDLETLDQYDVVLLFENGLFGNSRNVGNAVYDYVMNGGNLVIGTFYWQDRTGGYTWGNLETIDPFEGNGCEYNYGSLDPDSIVPHPITDGINSLWANSYRGGPTAKEDTTVLAKWTNGKPAVGYKFVEYSRFVAITIFPAYENHGNYGSDFGGDFHRLWENSLKWAATGGRPTERLIWQKNITVNISESETKNIVTEINIQDELGNVTGKLDLIATLYNHINSSQVINQSDRHSFFITDKNTSLTLETDKPVYKPDETITIYGEVRNNANLTDDYNLSIKKDGGEIFSDAFTLNPDQVYSFTTSTSSETSFTLEGTVDGVTVTDFVRVETPNVNVSIIAPDIVGISPFDVSVLIENIENIDAELNVGIKNNTWNLTIPEKESRLITTTMSITKNTTLAVTISGDVNKTIQKEIICGENTKINLTPQSTYLEGIVEIPYTIENIGLLNSEFNATFSIDDQMVSRSFFVPKGQNITDSVLFNLTKGAHLLRYISPFEDVNVTINVVSPPEFNVTSILPANMNFTLGQNVTLTFVVENIGGTEGEATLSLFMPDFEDTSRTWIRPGEEENISFNFTIPDDLEEKSYKGIYELDGERDEFTFFVYGANISVNAGLDKDLYEEGETASFTLDVTNECPFDLSLYARIKLSDYEEVKHFNLTDFETLQFDVPVHFNGQKLFYGIYMESGRALYLNAMYVHKKEIITLYTDKQVYDVGENVSIFVDTTKSGTLNITAPGFNKSIFLTASTVLEFELPNELRSGTYYIDYTFDDFSSAYPFDVIGYSARILECSLDKEVYNLTDVTKVSMNVEVNQDIFGVLKLWTYDAQNNLIDTFEMDRNFVEGENKIELSRDFSTSLSGIHVLVYGVYAHNDLIFLASGAEYFDVEGINQPPIADANGPYTGAVGSQITFNGTGSYDPDGTIVSYEWDLDDDGVFDDATGAQPTITFDEHYSGDIHLQVTDDDGATDIDTTTLTVLIPATIDFDPDTLNKKSEGIWVTVYTELPDGYNVTDINVSTMMLNETVPAELQPIEVGDYDSDGIPDLMVKFDRQAVSDIFPIRDTVDIAVTGKFYDGASFEGSDTIRVID